MTKQAKWWQYKAHDTWFASPQVEHGEEVSHAIWSYHIRSSLYIKAACLCMDKWRIKIIKIQILVNNIYYIVILSAIACHPISRLLACWYIYIILQSINYIIVGIRQLSTYHYGFSYFLKFSHNGAFIPTNTFKTL